MKSTSTSYLILLLFVGICVPLLAQKSKVVAPGLAAIALEKGEVEVILQNTYSFGARVFNHESAPYRFLDQKYQTLSTLLQSSIGISRDQNFNLGLDVLYNQIFLETKDTELPYTIFFGPRVRWRPFGDFDRTFDVTLQHYARFPAIDPFNSFAAKASPILGNEIILTKYFDSDAIRANLLLVAQMGFILLPKSRNLALDKKSPISTPLSLLFGIMPQRNLLFFVSLGANPEFGSVPWEEEALYFRRKLSVSLSLGFQVSLNNNLFLFASYSKTLYQEGSTFSQAANLGVRMTMGDYGYY